MESFVYCWTNTKTNQKYIGYHTGNEKDGYICSSKPMLKEYKKNPNIFIRKILAKGTEEDIRNFETLLLETINAKENKEFYNLVNHTQPQKSGWKHSIEAKERMSKARIGNKYSVGPSKKKSEGMKKYIQEHGVHESIKSAFVESLKGNDFTKNTKWFNNGKRSIMIKKGLPIPEGFFPGRIYQRKIEK